MPTKQELEDELNEKLSLEFEWSEMKKDDLLELRDGLEDEEFVKKFVGQYVNDVVGDKAQDQVEGWQPGQGIKMVAAMQEGDASPMDFFF